MTSPYSLTPHLGNGYLSGTIKYQSQLFKYPLHSIKYQNHSFKLSKISSPVTTIHSSPTLSPLFLQFFQIRTNLTFRQKKTAMERKNVLRWSKRVLVTSELSPSSPSHPKTVWTFAYGANMSKEVLNRRGVQALQSFPAELPSHTLVFNHRGGFGNIICRGEDSTALHVHGVVLKIRNEDMNRLKQFEVGYKTTPLTVRTYDGKIIEAKVFVSDEGMLLRQSLPPTSRYLKILKEAALFWKLDNTYATWLNSHESVRTHQLGSPYFATRNAYMAKVVVGVLALGSLIAIALHAKLSI